MRWAWSPGKKPRVGHWDAAAHVRRHRAVFAHVGRTPTDTGELDRDVAKRDGGFVWTRSGYRMQMPTTSAEVELPVPADEVWQQIGDFARIAGWHPSIASARLEDGGRVRRVQAAGGGECRERLVSKGPNWYSYELISGPLPVRSYLAVLDVVDVDGTAHVSWSAEFVPERVSADEAEASIKPFLQAGLDSLREQFRLAARPAAQGAQLRAS